jgi:hypothetical protein
MEASYVITGKFLRRSVLRRFLGVRGWVLLSWVLLISPLVIHDLQEGELSLTSIAFLVFLWGYVMMLCVAWRRQWEITSDWESEQGDVPVIYRFTPESVSVKSEMGETTVKWEVFERLTITPLHTLLVFSRRTGALTLPTDQISEEVFDFIIAQFRSRGLVVRDSR